MRWLVGAWALPGLACAQAGATWYQDRFAGALEGMEVSVQCESQRVCEYSFRSAPPPAKPALRQRSADISSVDREVASGNLAHTRDAAKANPALYSGREGAALTALRPLLESKAGYRECVSGNDGAWGPLCRLDTLAPGLPDAVLLMPTMNPSCDGRAFCAYFAIPLRRQPGG